MDLVKILSIAANGCVFILVIELIRRGRLKERYSLLWLFASGILLVLSSSRYLLEFFSHMLGIYYAPSFLFLLAFLFLLLITLHFSVVISGLYEKNKQLAQELALLRQDIQAGKSEGTSSNQKAKG